MSRYKLKKFSTATRFVCIFIFLINFAKVFAFQPSQEEIDFHNEPLAFDFHNILSFYEPNYFLAWYHTKNPDYQIYDRRTPNNVRIRQNEIKAQLSAYIILMHSILGNENLRLYGGYTQLFFWQFYSPTQFMREIDYQPFFYLKWHFAENMFTKLILDHQSNGTGGFMEVAWNRVIMSLQLTAKDFYSEIFAWVPFGTIKADAHQPQSLVHFLGYDKIVISYNLKDIVFSVEGQNIESAFKRGHIMASVSYSANSRVKLYAQYFTGYGQSLLEFDHYTSAFGIGIALSDWQ